MLLCYPSRRSMDQMHDFSSMTDDEIETWIFNYERKRATYSQLYGDLVEERNRPSRPGSQLGCFNFLSCLRILLSRAGVYTKQEQLMPMREMGDGSEQGSTPEGT